MVKSDKDQPMGKIYRQFSRQKYNKYKHQYPKMRQSQIVTKIIRQWDSLDYSAKQKLKKQYQQNKVLITEDISQSQTVKKIESAKKLQRETTAKKIESDEQIDKKVVKVENVESLVEKASQEGQNIKKENIQKIQKPKKYSKNKKIAKANSTDYINFFRHYYEKYSRQHPRWTASQVSKIIKLLWKKNKFHQKVSNLKAHSPILSDTPKVKKMLSGRTIFKNQKNLDKESTKKLWKHLPFESRRFWTNQAKEKPRQIIKEQIVTLKAQVKDVKNTFDFMKKPMK